MGKPELWVKEMGYQFFQSSEHLQKTALVSVFKLQT